MYVKLLHTHEASYQSLFCCCDRMPLQKKQLKEELAWLMVSESVMSGKAWQHAGMAAGVGRRGKRRDQVSTTHRKLAVR